MKSWKHFPHLSVLRSWWLWGSALSAFEFWGRTKGAGDMVDPVQPWHWITWAFAVAREISWIYPSAIPRWTKQGAPSQIAFLLKFFLRRRSVCILFHLLQCLTISRLWVREQTAEALLQPKTRAASQGMPWSLIDMTCTKPCMGVFKMLVWVSRCPSVRRKAPGCMAEDEGWWKAECRWELTRKVSTVPNWEVEVEQCIINYIP